MLGVQYDYNRKAAAANAAMAAAQRAKEREANLALFMGTGGSVPGVGGPTMAPPTSSPIAPGPQMSQTPELPAGVGQAALATAIEDPGKALEMVAEGRADQAKIQREKYAGRSSGEKAYRDVWEKAEQGWEVIDTAAQQAMRILNSDEITGDQIGTLITGLSKVRDPRTGVLQGEYAAAAGGETLLQRGEALGKMITGKGPIDGIAKSYAQDIALEILEFYKTASEQRSRKYYDMKENIVNDDPYLGLRWQQALPDTIDTFQGISPDQIPGYVLPSQRPSFWDYVTGRAGSSANRATGEWAERWKSR
jgi:hypothetical protein